MPMKRYVRNILIYLAALFGIVAFLGLFSSPLKSFNEIKGTWSVYNVRAYLGETVNEVQVYKGTFVPVFGYVIPFLLAIFLIIESFQPSWGRKLTVINTLLAIIFFICSILVLLTKELFLNVNNLGDTIYIKNGNGPITSSLFSMLAGVLLLLVTWVPGKKNITFIEK